MTHCHLCGVRIKNFDFADTCDQCAADGGAEARADLAAAEEFQCTQGTWV